MKIRKVARKCLVPFFHGKKLCIHFDKTKNLGYSLGDFFINSCGRPACTHPEIFWSRGVNAFKNFTVC
jgi:hypothetical protein